LCVGQPGRANAEGCLDVVQLDFLSVSVRLAILLHIEKRAYHWILYFVIISFEFHRKLPVLDNIWV
jgi:hypothetical protein